MKSTDLRPGMAIKMEGNIFLITQFQHVTPGNLRAFIQVKLKRIPDGSIIEKRLRSGEEVEQVNMDRREVEYLYADSSGYVFMDTQNYDQFNLIEELVGESMKYLKPNTQLFVLFTEGKAVQVELPKTVDLVVKDTPPGVKGGTVTNVMKEATMETGLKTKVPAFISIGEKIRISTEDGSYLSRA
ncbi:MAG: elongation factor P [Phycisphaeraceae bacterium]|nr:elongation factor P [Phycisphaeraceae bacterium]